MGLIVGPAICIGSTLQNNSSVSYFETEAEYIYRKSGGSDAISSGKATMSSIKGKSLVWNQLAQQFTAGTYGGAVVLTNNTDGTFTLNGTASSAANIYVAGNAVAGHKYYLANHALGTYSTSGTTGQVYGSNVLSLTTSASTKSVMGTATGSGFIQIRWHLSSGDSYTNTKCSLVFVDLTLMFGAGNEPTTVAEFEAMYPLPYYAYNAGEIVSNAATAIETVGFNQWDEEWEVGTLNWATGDTASSSSMIRSKNFIPVLPSTNYSANKKSGTGSNFRVCFYDASKAFISASAWSNNGVVITTGTNCRYIKIVSAFDGSTYNHDICINISNPAKNGTYQPYEKHTLNLNLPTLTGKLNGEGTSVTICPDGLKSAGSVYDEGIIENGYLTKIIKRVGVVDLGTLTWGKNGNLNVFYANVPEAKNIDAGRGLLCICSKYLSAASLDWVGWANFPNGAIATGSNYSTDRWNTVVKDSTFDEETAATFKTAVTGVKLIFELATPQTYILDTPIPVKYRVYNGGTEERLPKDTSSSVSAPIKYTVLYPKPKNN